MIHAKYEDKDRVVAILAKAFDDNKSVNYILKQDKRRAHRLKKLMEYSFDICYHFGDVVLTNNKKACALILLPDKKRTNFRSIFLDVKLIISCVGLSNLKKTLRRESRINTIHPKGLIYYLWFIGVEEAEQNKGTGSALLRDIIEESIYLKRPLCLETSTLRNIPWYHKFGFRTYAELDFGYTLFCLKRENT